MIKLRVPLTSLALVGLSGWSLMFAPAVAPVMALTSIFVLVGDFANTFGAYLEAHRARPSLPLPGLSWSCA
jgi:hypothetical protein